MTIQIYRRDDSYRTYKIPLQGPPNYNPEKHYYCPLCRHSWLLEVEDRPITNIILINRPCLQHGDGRYITPNTPKSILENLPLALLLYELIAQENYLERLRT